MPKIQIYKEPQIDEASTAETKSSSRPATNDGQQQEQHDDNDNMPSVAMAKWESCKENVQPICQGRKIDALMSSLSLINSKAERKAMIKQRQKQHELELEANEADPSKQLAIWSEYIDWLEQNVPDGGKENGITLALEQCIELYYDKKAFKQDTRILNIFMKFKRFCDEPREVFSFMYANSICTLLARFYLYWSREFELTKNMKRAQDMLKLGLKNLASPRELLDDAERQLKARIERLILLGQFESLSSASDAPIGTRELQQGLERDGIRAALQTLKFKVNKSTGATRLPVNRIGTAAVASSGSRNVGGLKSQLKMVNGVLVAKTSSKKTASSSRVAVAATVKDGQVISEPPLIKVPTSQHIKSLGRSGKENQLAVQHLVMGPPRR